MAFSYMWVLQRACEVQLASSQLGKLRAIPEPVLEKCVRDALNFDPEVRRRGGLVRRIAAVWIIDPGYRA